MNKIFKQSIKIFVCALFALFSACNANQNIITNVTMPQISAIWGRGDSDGASEWELTWVSANSVGGPYRIKEGHSIKIPLPRSSDAIILARAVFGANRSKPYGAIWPLEHQDRSLVLSPESGYAASILEPFLRAGRSQPEFNIRHFIETAVKRIPDIWDIDPSSLAAIIHERRFRADHIKAITKKSITISGITSTLYPDSPFGTILEADINGSVTCLLGKGQIKRWMNKNTELCVTVLANGEAVWTISKTSF